MKNKFTLIPGRLDSLFMEELTEKGISGKTNIAFITDSSVVWGKQDKVNFFYYSTPFQMQGIDPIDKIQGYVKYNVWLVLSRMDSLRWIVRIVVMCILMGGYMFIRIKRVHVVKKVLTLPQPLRLALPLPLPKPHFQSLLSLPVHKVEEPQLIWVKIGEDCFQCGDVVFDPERRRLYSKKSKGGVQLSEQLVQLLILFVKAEVRKNESKDEDKGNDKDKDVKVSDIVLTFWPDEQDVKKRSIKASQLVHKLKKELSKIMIVEFKKAGTFYLFKYRLK